MSTIVAAIYVCYCAYYLTMDDMKVQITLNFMLMFLYCYTLILLVKNCLKVYREIKAEQRVIRDNNITSLRESNRLKMKMIK
jgi:hypothetical protein